LKGRINSLESFFKGGDLGIFGVVGNDLRPTGDNRFIPLVTGIGGAGGTSCNLLGKLDNDAIDFRFGFATGIGSVGRRAKLWGPGPCLIGSRGKVSDR